MRYFLVITIEVILRNAINSHNCLGPGLVDLIWSTTTLLLLSVEKESVYRVGILNRDHYNDSVLSHCFFGRPTFQKVSDVLPQIPDIESHLSPAVEYDVIIVVVKCDRYLQMRKWIQHAHTHRHAYTQA